MSYTSDNGSAAFARRLNRALDCNRVGIPGKFKGQQRELAKRLTDAGADTTPETVSKWLRGTTTPRALRLERLAKVLGLDLAWLEMGTGGDDPIFARPETNVGENAPPPAVARPQYPRRTGAPDFHAAMVRGLALALVHLSGAKVVDPLGDGVAQFSVAAGGGAVLSVFAVLGERDGEVWRVSVPKFAESTYILGILPETATSFIMIELYWDDLMLVGEARSDDFYVEINADLQSGDVQWRRITGFSGRPRL